MTDSSPRVRLTVEVTDELNERLDRLADELGGSKSDVFRTAIALVEVALNAKRRGGHVAILDDEQRIVATVVGL
jgi:predicted transcriptional regulator